MVDIKALLLSALEDAGYTAKAYQSSRKALEDAEKMVFSDSAVALGDYRTDRAVYSIGIDKINHSVELLLFIKSKSARENIQSAAASIQQLLRRNNFGKSNLLLSSVSDQSELSNYNDRIQYLSMQFSTTELEQLIWK